MSPSAGVRSTSGARAARLLMAAALLAGSALTPALASAAGESILIAGAVTNPGATEVAMEIAGDPETNYEIRIAAADTCLGASAPEAVLTTEDPIIVTTETDGSGVPVTYTESPITPGWFAIATLLTEDGSTTLATSACALVTEAPPDPPFVTAAYILEPDRDAILLDYGFDGAPADCSLALDPSFVPDPADYSVTLDGGPSTVTSVEFEAGPCPYTVELGLDAALPTGSVDIAYAPGANPIRNQAGVLASGFGPFQTPGFVRERSIASLAPGASTTTDGEEDGAVGTDLVETTVTASAAGGAVSVDIREATQIGLAGPDLRYFPLNVRVDTVGATPAAPVAIEFVLATSLLTDVLGEPFPIAEVEVRAHGAAVAPCAAGSGGQAIPEPCEVGRSLEADGLHVTIRAADADRNWAFGANLPPKMIAFETPHLASLDHVILSFFEEIDPASLPAPEDFTVLVDGAPRTPTHVTLLATGLGPFSSTLGIDGGLTFLELGWDTPATGFGTITVGYAPGADPIRDLQGQVMAATTVDAIITAENFALALVEDATGPNHVLLFLPGRLSSLPAAADFELQLEGTAYTPTDVVQRYPHLGVTLLDLTLPIDLEPGQYPSLFHVGATPLTYVDATQISIFDLFVETIGLSGMPPGTTEESPTPVTVTPPDASTLATTVSITFPQVTGSGSTTVASSIETSAPDPVPTNFAVGNPAAYYDIATTATFTPPAEVCIAYNPGAYADESAIELLHYEAGAWTPVTTSLDTDANVVCGEVGSFSPFAIVEPATGPTFEFAGFFAPVDNLPTTNTVSAGRAIPVKFSLGGDHGLDIFGAGSPSSVRVPCPSSPDLDAIESAAPASALSLSYDPASDRYTYVWKTSKGWSGTCRMLTIVFADGTTEEALFKFGR